MFKLFRRQSTIATVIIFIMFSMDTMTMTAQDRMPPVPENQMTPDQAAAAEEFKQVRNRTQLTGPFVPLLRSPEMLSRARNIGDYVRFDSVLPPRLSEFVILITARHWTQNYEWSAHAPIAEREGLNPLIISAVADGRRPEEMANDEAALYDFCTELLHNHDVSDSTYSKMLSHFKDMGVIDTIGIIGYYSMLAMVMNTARTPLREGDDPALKAFPR